MAALDRVWCLLEQDRTLLGLFRTPEAARAYVQDVVRIPDGEVKLAAPIDADEQPVEGMFMVFENGTWFGRTLMLREIQP